MGTSRHKASKGQAEAVRNLVREQVAQVEHIERAALRPLSEVLLAARHELRRDLAAWLKTVKDPTDKFTAHQMRVMLRTLEPTINTLGIRMSDMLEAGKHPSASAMDRAMLKGLLDNDKPVGALAVRNLEREIVRLGKTFGQSLTGPDLDTVAVLARGNKLVYRRAVNSSHRYAGKIGEDMRFQLAIGVARNETFEQLTQRLRRLAGPTGPVALRGVLGHPSSVVEDIPEGLFARYDSWARRIVRTEMMTTYNDRHRDGIAELNSTRGKHEPEWLRKSDAAGDSRVCSICRWLDGKTCKIGESFPGGYGAPPYHPCCRCVELAWLAEWPDDLGEIHPEKAVASKASRADYRVDVTPPAPKPRAVPTPHEKPQHEHASPPAPHVDDAPIEWQKPKNPKRVEAARKAGDASAERRREIHSAVKSNLSPDLHVAWDKEGHKYMRQEAGRIKGIKDPINAASKISEAFTETYGSGEATAFGNEGDRYFKRAELEAAHAETWADEQEKKYYEEMQRHALAEGEINEHGELTDHGRSKLEHDVEITTAKPPKGSDDDPPF